VMDDCLSDRARVSVDSGGLYNILSSAVRSFGTPVSIRKMHITHYNVLQCTYNRSSISGTTFSGKRCLSGTIFHAI
jgi:hypothetical protein